MASWAPSYGIADQLAQVEALTARLISARLPFSVDIETGYDGEPKEKAQLHPEEGFVVGISLTNSSSWARYIPLRHDSGPNLDNHKVAELLWPLMRTGLGLAWNNLFEWRFLSRWFTEYLGDHSAFGPEVKAAHLGLPEFTGYFPWCSDAMLERHAEGESRNLSLKDGTQERFGHVMTELDELFAKCGFGMGDMDEALGVKVLTKKQKNSMRFNELDLLSSHREEIVNYACEDALWALLHHRQCYSKIMRHPQRKFIYQLEMNVLPVVAMMADEGILYDWKYMREGAQHAAGFLERYTTEIQNDLDALRHARGLEGQSMVNLASTQQLARVLYEELGFRIPVRTKKTAKGGGGNPSTGKVAMQALRHDNPVIQKIVNHKSLTRLKGTYLEKYEPDFGYCQCGRTHPDWMQCGVPAGRFAAAAPPVQQSPKKYRYELADDSLVFQYDFRYAIMAPPGWYILGFDYAQQERRALAGEAQEQALIDAFNKGLDIHKTTASGLFKVPYEAVDDEQRAGGKTLGFAMDYGLGEEGLADRMGISVEEARGLSAAYFAAYPSLKPYTERIIATAHRDGYLITTFGRRVPIWGINDSSRNVRSGAERTAGNAAIQGPATGDYPKIAMVRATAALRQAGLIDKVRLIMNMHDALEWYVRDDVPPQLVISVLQPAVVFTAPQIAHWPKLVAEWHMGRRWSTVVELDVQLGVDGQVSNVRPKAPKHATAVHQTQGDEDEELQVDAGALRALTGAPQESPAAVRAESTADVRHPGAAVPDSPVLGGEVIITASHTPDKQCVASLFQMLARHPGDSPVFLRIGADEVLVASGSSVTPVLAPEVALLLGDPAVTVTYRGPHISTGATFQGNLVSGAYREP